MVFLIPNVFFFSYYLYTAAQKENSVQGNTKSHIHSSKTASVAGLTPQGLMQTPGQHQRSFLKEGLITYTRNMSGRNLLQARMEERYIYVSGRRPLVQTQNPLEGLQRRATDGWIQLEKGHPKISLAVLYYCVLTIDRGNWIDIRICYCRPAK